MPQDAEVYSRLGNIEAKVDILLARDVSTDKRLAKLEKFEAKVIGISTVVSLIAGYIAKHF